LRIVFDKVERRLEVSATITEAVAQALDKAKGLSEEALLLAGGDLLVTAGDIAGARYVLPANR
jgi:hypothetical protein